MDPNNTGIQPTNSNISAFSIQASEIFTNIANNTNIEHEIFSTRLENGQSLNILIAYDNETDNFMLCESSGLKTIGFKREKYFPTLIEFLRQLRSNYCLNLDDERRLEALTTIRFETLQKRCIKKPEPIEPTKLFDEDGRIKLRLFAEEIKNEMPILTDMRTFQMYRFNGKIWRDDAEAYIQKRLVEVEKDDYKPYHLTTLIEIIQGITFVPELEEPPPHLICVENGVLDIKTMELKPHSPTYFFSNMIHAKYDPNAKPTKFLEWLNSVLPEKEKQDLIQELFGYCLYRDYFLHHIFFLVGQGRNGKGTLMRTLMRLLGQENISSIPLDRIDERFQTSFLYHKLANIVSEPDTGKMSEEEIKKLTGQDFIEAELKGLNKTRRFINYAKIIVMANRLPPVKDNTQAWWERVIMIEFNISIPKENIIPNIEENWVNDETEMSGILNWAIEGLLRLLKNKRFSLGEETKNAIETYKKWSNSVEYFIETKCEYNPNYWISREDLWNAYVEFCEEEGLDQKRRNILFETIRYKGKVNDDRIRVQGKITRIFRGVGLKKDTPQPSDITTIDKSVTDVPAVPALSNWQKFDNQIFKESKTSVTSVTSVTPTKEKDGVGQKNDRPKLFRCKTCGDGPWKLPETAKEHKNIRKDHEIIEVDENLAFLDADEFTAVLRQTNDANETKNGMENR
ncbi:MAG: phage/plasmid primase, P4 family [Nitrososphaeria archaeon]